MKEVRMPGVRTGNDKMLRVFITTAKFETLAGIARRENRTVSDVVRDAINHFLSENEKAA